MGELRLAGLVLEERQPPALDLLPERDQRTAQVEHYPALRPAALQLVPERHRPHRVERPLWRLVPQQPAPEVFGLEHHPDGARI